MNNISCNVIRDLLPSYTDGIASDDSVKLVEEHLAECTECMAFKNRMEKPDLHLTDKDVSLDYMKKIRKLTDFKSAVCLFLVLITGVLFLGYTKDLHQPKPFFILSGVMLLCNYLLFFHNNEKKAGGNIKAILPTAVSILFAGCTIFLMHLTLHNWIHDKNAPFNIDYEVLGPFLHHSLVLAMMIEIIIWLREIVLHFRKAHFSITNSSFSIIGFYMSLYYERTLKTIDTLDGFQAINNNALILFAEGIGILLLLLIIEKGKKKKIAGNAAF
ncbi:MAG: zf-HC2 domain-containing protein [Lachnospiraceae bacterium]|nr:zf-HC2 domain-containing protein [Lachnospiraceae bacterium]